MHSEHQPTNESFDEPKTRWGGGSMLTAILVAVLSCAVGVWYQVGDLSMFTRAQATSNQKSQSGSLLAWLFAFTSSQGCSTHRSDRRSQQSDYVLEDIEELERKRDEAFQENAEMMDQIRIQVQEQANQWAR